MNEEEAMDAAVRDALVAMDSRQFEKAAKMAGLEVRTHREWTARLVGVELMRNPLIDNPTLKAALLPHFHEIDLTLADDPEFAAAVERANDRESELRYRPRLAPHDAAILYGIEKLCAAGVLRFPRTLFAKELRLIAIVAGFGRVRPIDVPSKEGEEKPQIGYQDVETQLPAPIAARVDPLPPRLRMGSYEEGATWAMSAQNMLGSWP